MKRIGLVITAILAMALLVPALSMAQGTQTVTIKGNVYNGALPVDGAKVQIYSWDGRMGTSPMATVYSQTINGVPGSFVFNSVPYDPTKTFNWAIQADSNGAQAHALVYIVPAEKAGQSPIVSHVNLDVGMWDWKTDLQGMVQSGNLAQNGLPVNGANVSIYKLDNGTVGKSPVASAITDSSGQIDIKNILDYGQYQAVVTKDNYMETANFTAYQQETHILVTMTNIKYVTPTPTPTPGSKTNGGGGLFGLPGFEAVLALLAVIVGAALVLRKR